MAETDNEFVTMQTVYNALEPLPPDARQRVMDYINSRLEISTSPGRTSSNSGQEPDKGNQDSTNVVEEVDTKKFDTIADLYDAFQPKSQADKALVAGYWKQVLEGNKDFDAQSANTLLKDLGYGISNITNAIEGLKTQTPALVIQTKKSGSSQQARKTYKVTDAGKKYVESMISG